MPTALIARCSLIYEALKQRVFGGDSDKLLAWSRGQAGLADDRYGDR
ncbi:MAG TPA: hypothetical protein VFQ20_01435 [Burkholderiaceae bacterium]|nr:hypothetical protein [Burkholderiaceae bacterium]